MLRPAYTRHREQKLFDLFVYFKYYLPHREFQQFVSELKALLYDLKSKIDERAFEYIRAVSYTHLSDKVYKVFSSLGYQEDIVVMLTNLCCLNGCLPQGAPTSPIISNIILKKFDDEVGKFTNEKKIRYTRYADDMTFSGDFNPGQIISFVKNRLYELGLKLNEEKTRTRKKSQRQEVTGIVVNEKMQLPKSVRRKIRQEIYYIRKFGLESHMQYCGIEKKNYLSHLKGKIQYGLFINPYDYELQDYLSYLKKLMS